MTEELIEKHQCRKCEKCPCHWSDGYSSEEGCYLDEGRACKMLLKFFKRRVGYIHLKTLFL